MEGPTRIPRESSSSRTRPSPSTSTPTSAFGSATGRFTKDSLAVLNSLKARLPEHVQPYFWLGLWFGTAMLILGLVIAFHSKIFHVLQALADLIKGLGPLGPPVIMLCLLATSFPPIIGYSSLVTMAGYVYGFVYGFVIVFSGALVGSIICFYLCRRWFKAHVRKLMAKNKSLKGVVRTVEKRGFRLLVLIRLAPYPFNVMNAILSATHIPLSTYIPATAISLVKLTLHVYIGSTLSTLAGGDGDKGGENKDPNNHGKRLKVFVLVMGIIFGIGLSVYIWIVASREIAITEAARMERRLRRRRRGMRHGARGDDGRGIELSDQHRQQQQQQGYIPDVDLTSRDSADGFYSGAAADEGGRDLSEANYFVGGAGSRYQDDDEDEGHEGHSLFGNGRVLQQQQGGGGGGDWRNVGGARNDDSFTDSDESDYFDDDESDDDSEGEGDLERGLGLGLNNGSGYDDDGEGEEEALDFSAHHAGLVDSPWQDGDDDADDNGSHDLLEGSRAQTGIEIDDRAWRSSEPH
ncbi:hypothetical protein BGX23_006728 [Mortierella sp. AD031]|nr:hypothetical protein BGX23_006728 [Mortierella sp. AD031]